MVTFLARDVARGLLIWDLKDLLMSGGGGGLNIPFDIIYNVDIDDPSTWNEPSQTMLDLGFNIWYQQMPTPRRPEPNLYLGKVEGSMPKGLAKTYAVGKAGIPFNREMIERMEREGRGASLRSSRSKIQTRHQLTTTGSRRRWMISIPGTDASSAQCRSTGSPREDERWHGRRRRTTSQSRPGALRVCSPSG